MSFFRSEITHANLDATPVGFGTIKEGIMELMDEHLGAYQAEIAVGQLGSRNLSHQEFKARGALNFFGKDNLIASRR